MNPSQSGNTRARPLTVIVPTFNEAENVPELVRRLGRQQPLVGEVIFVDDSSDTTPQVIERTAETSSLPIVLHHRPPGQRQGGLGGAVVAGLRLARHDRVVVMDGDLQHPPETIPALARQADDARADLVVASRHTDGGRDRGLSPLRKLVSRASAVLSRFLFPLKLGTVTDPMSGFFLIRRDAIPLDRLRPHGFKILLEIAIRARRLQTAEVGFEFGQRFAGETKASLREGFRYLRQLAVLRTTVSPLSLRGRFTLRSRAAYHYSVHGIVTVSSDARLPELSRFRVDEPIIHPDIRVRVADPRRHASDDGVLYMEWPGRLGFGVAIRRAEPTDIVVTRLVAWSPHVLYTNTVEPVLRWMFVERGYALVHAACVEHEGNAYLITAKTDTGKTTTMLKVLDEMPLGFVSDDMTLVNSEGGVLPYPKPLTISRHTLTAVKRPTLSRRQRLGLPIQSRLHSRSGRKVGFALARTKLPVATMNAMAQRLIPPPKYDITQLVPTAEVADKAGVRGMIVIERGGSGETILEPVEALDVLLLNCEDAYGFPPYEAIEPYLRFNGSDLKNKEREIISAAFAARAGLLLRSESLDWAHRIADLLRESAQPANGHSILHRLRWDEPDLTVDLREPSLRPVEA